MPDALHVAPEGISAVREEMGWCADPASQLGEAHERETLKLLTAYHAATAPRWARALEAAAIAAIRALDLEADGEGVIVRGDPRGPAIAAFREEWNRRDG